MSAVNGINGWIFNPKTRQYILSPVVGYSPGDFVAARCTAELMAANGTVTFEQFQRMATDLDVRLDSLTPQAGMDWIRGICSDGFPIRSSPMADSSQAAGPPGNGNGHGASSAATAGFAPAANTNGATARTQAPTMQTSQTSLALKMAAAPAFIPAPQSQSFVQTAAAASSAAAAAAAATPQQAGRDYAPAIPPSGLPIPVWLPPQRARVVVPTGPRGSQHSHSKLPSVQSSAQKKLVTEQQTQPQPPAQSSQPRPPVQPQAGLPTPASSRSASGSSKANVPAAGPAPATPAAQTGQHHLTHLRTSVLDRKAVLSHAYPTSEMPNTTKPAELSSPISAPSGPSGPSTGESQKPKVKLECNPGPPPELAYTYMEVHGGNGTRGSASPEQPQESPSITPSITPSTTPSPPATPSPPPEDDAARLERWYGFDDDEFCTVGALSPAAEGFLAPKMTLCARDRAKERADALAARMSRYSARSKASAAAASKTPVPTFDPVNHYWAFGCRIVYPNREATAAAATNGGTA